MESDFQKSMREFLARKPFGFRGLTEDQLALFCEALTHDSYTNEMANMHPPQKASSYERLEFLGDAILEFLVCEHVYLNTDLTEGPMTDYKQDKVANHMISQRVLENGPDIDGMMRVGHGHIGQNGKLIEDNMRADSYEAIVAAIYLCFGMDEARRFVNDTVLLSEH